MNNLATIVTYSLTLFACALSLSACSPQEPVQIGFIGGISGAVADLGVAGRNGVMLAVEERNAAGGINGRPVDLIIKDVEQNPETAKRVVTELLARKIEVIIGPMTSSIAMATVPLVNNSPAIMISPTVTTTALSGKDDNFIRVISSTTDYAAKGAKYQFNRLGHRTISAIYELNNKPYSESWLNDFRTTFESLGGQIKAIEGYHSGETKTFYDLAKKLIDTKPDAILVITHSLDAALICQQIRKISPKIPIVMSEWASTERFTELAGNAANGVVVSQFVNRNDTSERYQKFRKSYHDRFGQEPGFSGLAGYDAAIVAMETLIARKPGQSLKEVLLKKGTFQGVQQPIRIDRFGDADRKTFITVIQDGKYLTRE